MKIKKLLANSHHPVVINFTNKLDKDFCNLYCPPNISVPGCQSKNIRKPRNNSGAFFIGTQKEGIY
jgi:hypothetical protein